HLSVVGSRRRTCRERSGKKNVLIIRRMWCKDCQRIHHELPDLLVPYKRYTAESLEQIIDDRKPVDVAADESTLNRWLVWFQVWKFYVAGCLRSISKRFP